MKEENPKSTHSKIGYADKLALVKSISMSDKDLIDKGIDVANDGIDKGIDVVNDFIDWLTGTPSSQSKSENEDKDEIICHCTKKDK